MKQEYTVGDLGGIDPKEINSRPNLLTAINRIISLNEKFKKEVLVAKRYYENNNDIVQLTEEQIEQKIVAVDTNPLRHADNRVPHNYHQILVDQKSSYLFGQMVLLKSIKPKVDKSTEKVSAIKLPLDGIQSDTLDQQKPTVQTSSKEDMFDEKLSTLSKKLQRYLNLLCIEASNAGKGWLYPYINEKSEFKYAVINSEELIPIYGPTIEKELLYMIRFYLIGKDKMIEFHTNESITVWKNNKFVEDRSQFMLGQLVRGQWGSLPFIEFANNPIKQDDLHKYKKLIDVYDKTISLYANDIEDLQELIFVLVNYGGVDLDEFLSDMRKYKVVKADANGKLETLKVDIPVEARIKLLEIIDNAIWTNGQGVNPKLQNLGNLSGVALKQLYGLLELKASALESEFRAGVDRLIEFYKLYLKLNDHEDYTVIEIDQIYTRSMISNNTELVTMAQNSVGIISDETIISNHPWVEDPQSEMDRIKAEKEVKAQAAQDAFGLNTDVPATGSAVNEKIDSNAKQDLGLNG